ncbi:MAG: 3'-5' exonuclease [Bacteroidetes bacterium]|nr:3'-5' exonuclease [Bacteroidota bacterium]
MPYLILDLEMTGGETDYHDIIQIGAVLADDDWRTISEYETLVYPDNEENFTSYAEEVHGISIYDLEDAPQSYDALIDFEEWIRKSLKRNQSFPLTDIVVCGQSVINDINFLKQKYSDQRMKWPFSFKLIDLLSVSYIFFQIFDVNNVKRPTSYSLKAVAAFFDLQRENDTHSAMEDAKLTYLCFKNYFSLIKKIKYPG